MVARAREENESFEDYRKKLTVEAHDIKMRLKLGPKLYKTYKEAVDRMTIDIDEVHKKA